MRILNRWSRLVFALCYMLMTAGIQPVPTAYAQTSQARNFEQFDFLTADTGWILFDQHIYWTVDAGGNWRESTPHFEKDPFIEAVTFIDPSTGWVLSSTGSPDSGASFALSSTQDGGQTWTSQSLPFFEPGEIASYAEKAQMDWFDSQHGWIAIKQATSSNFSVGTLFTTSDGGVSWQRAALPVADQISFHDPQNGWAVGEQGSRQLFLTDDAGATWENQPVHATFVGGSDGFWLSQSEDHTLRVYARDDSSQGWSTLGEIKLDAPTGRVALSVLDANNFVASIPGTQSMLSLVNGTLSITRSADGRSASIVDVDMISLEVGWAVSIDSNCITRSASKPDTASVSCASTTRLLHTADGGITWQDASLPGGGPGLGPNVPSEASETITSSIASTGNTEAFLGQGFDRCEIPTLAQMQTWSNNSPYKVVNLYIGGSSRACDNAVLRSSYLFLLNQQGWKFIPTWVGPQAPCTGYPSRMSSDVTTAYNEGLIQANLAADRLSALGLTGPAKTGSVVYYDIEHYGTNSTCRAAVNAFINGWVAQLRERGHSAGVYGSTLCNTGLSDFQTIANVPDVMWAARWYHNLGEGYYDPDASVWNLGSCLPNSAWANHQRIRQYEGDHNETWGNLTLDIDSNVLDGLIAIPFAYPYVSKIARNDPNFSDAKTANFTVTFSKPVTGVNMADFSLTTTGVANASIVSVDGSGATYTVGVNTGTGDGTIRLDLIDDDSIQDEVPNPLGGAGKGNGSYTYGEVYTILKSKIADTVGVFRPSNGVIFLKNTNTSGFADVALNYGVAGDYPVVGDWDGDGDDTIGVYRNGTFLLRNSNTAGYADLEFIFGQPGDQPIAGDWDGDGTDTIGVYRNGTFLLRNSNSTGDPDITFNLGNAGDVGIAGDWDGNGTATTGVFRPSNGVIFLKNKNESGFADIALNYGLSGDQPVVGDWDNNGTTTIGVFRKGKFLLRNSNTKGFADITVTLGVPTDMPIAGNWDGLP